MSSIQFSSLRGNAAFSTFRLEKLYASLNQAVPNIACINARFIHFVFSKVHLNIEQQTTLEQILTYGPVSNDSGLIKNNSSAAVVDSANLASISTGINADIVNDIQTFNSQSSQNSHQQELFLVIPRIGTISPWASRATDIANNCGLSDVLRLERGIAFYVTTHNGLALNAQEKATFQTLIHDRMTETVVNELNDAQKLYHSAQPTALSHIDILKGSKAALVNANSTLGLALSSDEIDYLFDSFIAINRNPTDVELMMFAQANSEHCRHKIFNADWIIDDVTQDNSLFGMIRNTHQLNPGTTVVAYSDNSSIVKGQKTQRFYPNGSGEYGFVEEEMHYLMKVETHNHPTAISPFAGAATGAGGEIRDEGATGTGSKPKAGLTGFSVSNLNIPKFSQAWEANSAANNTAISYGKPDRIASALQIMLEGPIGGAAYNNEFGRPNIAGYFRTFELETKDTQGKPEIRGYHKPIMLAGGVGNISAQHAFKKPIPAGAALIQLGGPAMLIGLGGSAASSMDTGSNTEHLDFDSVQRGNPELQRRAQEVIDRCWQLGEQNPIVSIHDVWVLLHELVSARIPFCPRIVRAQNGSGFLCFVANPQRKIAFGQ